MTPARRILIIEDNPINQALLDYLLRAYGFTTSTATDGARGLALAAQQAPDLILCDIQMPGMDGLEFARRAKADPALRNTPLMAVTAYAMVGDRDRILAAGFDGYIAKPIDAEELLAAIQRLLTLEQPPTAVPAPPAAPPGVAPPTRLASILVVDDTPFNLELKHRLLQPHGYEVLTASTPSSALALARQRSPALIVSDVGLPEGGGFAFIRQVKADPGLRQIPFIFLTSTHWDESLRQQGLQLGALRYLLRPLEPAQLLEEIRACLGANP